jgi:2-succinyl-6-hydroxy-2,4-cyclohexadiene-1-carboxylate synthase
MPTINLFGVRHTYDLTQSLGTQPALVFVHGWLLSRLYWQPLIQSLSPRYPCLSYDLRGFGESNCQQDDLEEERFPASHVPTSPLVQSHFALRHNTPYTPAAYALDLLELLDRLHLSNVWLVGHSLGGSIALWVANLAPERVNGVVCLNAGGGLYLKEDFDRFRTGGSQMLTFRPPWLSHFPLLDVLFSRMMVAKPLPRKWGNQRLKDFLVAHPEAALRSLLDSTVPEEVYQLPQIVAKLRQPTYFMAGQQDAVMEMRYVYHLASFHHSFQDGQQNVIEIPDCGHFSMLEQTDLIAATVTQLLEDCSAKNRSPSSHSAVS